MLILITFLCNILVWEEQDEVYVFKESNVKVNVPVHSSENDLRDALSNCELLHVSISCKSRVWLSSWLFANFEGASIE